MTRLSRRTATTGISPKAARHRRRQGIANIRSGGLLEWLIQYNTIQYKTYNAPYVTKMLFVGAEPLLYTVYRTRK